MATEANILDSVCLKKGEREENALASEVFEGKVTGVETSSDVAEIVNTPLVTDKPTDESGFFYQALSAISDVFSNTPDSFKAAKQSESENKETTENEEKAAESVEDILADFEEQELKETPRELGKSVDAQEVTEQREIGSKNIEEQKSEESAEKIEKDESKEIKPDIETEKGEQTGLLQAITSDTAISTHTKSKVETTEHEEEDTDSPLMKEVCEEKEANEHQVVKSREEEAEPILLKESIKIEEKAIEKAEVEISDSTIEKEQGDPDGVTSSPCVDAEETPTGINFKERDLDEMPEETENKSINAPEVSEECEKEAKEEIDQNPEESVKKIDKEDETEEVKPDVEIEEKEEQDELLPAVTKDEVKHSAIANVTKDENKDEEKEQDVLEKDEGEHDATSARDVTFEKDLQEKNHHNEDDVTEVVTAEESTEKDTEVIKFNKFDEEATETGQGLSATQRETFIEETKDRSVDAQEKSDQYDDGANDEKEQKLDECVNETAHSTKEQEEHTEEIKPKVETTEEKDVGILTQTKFQEETTQNEENFIEGDGVQKEKSDNPVDDKLCEESDLKQNESKEEGQISDIVDEDTEEAKSSDVITAGVSSSTQREYIEKAIESKENTDEGQKEKLDNPLVEEVCEATSSKIAESEEGVKHSESSSMTPTVDETLSKEEEFEKKDDIKESEAQGGENDVTSSQHASTEDIKETMIGQHDTTVAHVEGVSALPKEILIEEAEDKSIDAEEMSLKLGQPNPEDEIKKEDKDLSHESVEDINDDSTKEKCTLEQEPVEEHTGQNEIIKEIVSDLSETTEVEPQEDITHSTSFETSTKDASNIEKEKAESENLPTEDLETVSQLQIPELVPKSEECVISEKEIHLDEEIGTVAKEVSSDEKTEVQYDGDDVISSRNAPNEDIQESKIGQHDTTVSYVEEGLGVSATPKEISRESMEDTNDDTAKEETCKLEQEPGEEHTRQDEVSKVKVTDLNETTQVEPQDDITPSISLETSTEDTSNSEKEKAEITQVEPQEDIPLSTSLLTSTEDPLNLEKEKVETENLSIEDLETVSEVKISEESVLKEECFNSETKTLLNEEKEIITKETLSDEKPEVQSGGEDVISSQNEPSEDIKETTIGQHESINAEETSLKLGQPNEQNVEETISQTPEDEIKKEDRDLLHNIVENTIDDPAKEEKCEVEHEPIEEHSGLADVSNEYITELNETTQVEPREDITPSNSLKPSTEEASNSEKEKAETENLPLEDLGTVSDVQIPELVPKSEESVLKEDCFISESETQLDEEKRTVTEEISNDEKTELNKETVTEVCEETNSENTEFEEGLKLSDTSYTKINEKEITFKDEDEDKDQEVIMSPESQGEDNITSSQIEVSEEKEDLQKKNSHNEGNEDGFIKSGEGLHEDTEEIKSSVETQEDTEPNADSIKNEEKNDENAVVNDENEIVNRDAGLELKQDDIKETDIGEDAITVTSIEEGQSLGTITKEILNEAEGGDNSVTGQEKSEQHDIGENDEQKPEEHTEEIKPSVETNEEKVCISTQNESQEEPTKNEENVIEHDDQKENLDSLFVKEVCEESDSTKTESEEKRVSDISDVKTREIVDEDTEETKLTDVSSSTQAENIEITTASEVNNDEETRVHDEGQTEKPQSPLVEVACEATSSEIAESEEEVKHSESFSTTLNDNETLSKEEIVEKEDDIKTSEVKGSGVEVTSSQDTSNEDIKETTIGQHDATVAHVEEQCVSETPKETVMEEAEDKSVKAEEISLEHEQPNGQNVEETHPCPSETIRGNSEDEIKKENKELSFESVEDINDDTTKEEKYALKHESVEEHSGLDEVSNEKVSNINEAIEVEPKEDISPSASLETSTEDISNSGKEKIETENLPKDDLETVSEVVAPRPEEFVQKEECFVSETETHLDEEKGTITEEISSDEKTEHATEIKQETIKDICEKTSSENAELDTSNIKMNEKELTAFKDDDQEINMSAESKGKNNVTSSQIEESEEKEDMQEKNDHNEDNEGDFIKTGESVHEDTEEIKSTTETKENTEHVVTTSSSRQIEPAEEAIEKNGEITSGKIDLEKNPENVCSLTQTDSKEEITESKETNEESIENEKEQESITKDITREEVEDKSIHAEAASEQSEESVKKPVNSCADAIEESIKEDADAQNNKGIESEQEAENQAGETEDRTEIENEAVLAEKVSKELQQTKEQNVEEIEACLTETISEKTEDNITKNEDLSHESIEQINRNITKEEKCFPDVITKEIDISALEPEPVKEQNDSQDEVSKEKLTDLKETTTVEPENSYSTTEENVTHSEVELNNTEGCSEIVKDVILTEEIEQVPLEIEKEKEINDCKEQIVEKDQKELVNEKSNSDSIPAENPEVTEDISCVSKVTTDVDQEPKKEEISSLEDAATVESEVDLSNRESTAYPLEGEKLATRDLESDCDVKIPEVVADLEGSKAKEECVVLATAEYADENSVEKQVTKSDEISSAPDKSSDLIIEEKALTKEQKQNLEIHGKLEPASEPMIEEQVITKTNPQPEQTEITCENIKNDQTSESKLEEEFTFASGNEIKSIESQNETTKNIILTDEVSEKDNCPTELDSTSTPDQKELANEIEYSKPIADANTEVAEVKEEIQTEVEDIKAAEDLSCLSKASSNIETSKVEMHEDTTVPVLEDSKSSELQSTDRELVSELQTFSADQIKVNERCIESEDQGNFVPEIKGEKSEKEVVEDVIINEVIVEDKSINEEAKLNQLTTETDEVSQIEKSSSRPDEFPGTKDSVEDTEELKFIADSLNLKDETLTAIKEPNEENETVASEYKLEAKSVIDATAEKANNDDLIEVSQTYPEGQKYEVPAGTESKISTEKIDSSYKQEKPVAEPLTPEAAKMKPDTTSVFIDQTEKSESVVPAKILFQEPAERKSEVGKDQQVDKEETGVKTDEEYEEEEDNEDDEKTGSCSDAPVMVEASKDIEVKAHKKSHNLLSGVGSKVKHSIAKVKKAITGKSSPTKPPSPKVKDQVLG